MKRVLLGIIISLMFLFLSCSNSKIIRKQGKEIPYWKIASPESQGMNSTQLTKMFDYIGSKTQKLDSIIIVRNGYIVLEAYFSPNNKTTKHWLQSCTKSFTSALIGIAIDKGYIKNVDDNVLTYFTDKTFANTDSLKKEITIKHLLTMNSGIRWPQVGPNNISDRMGESADWVQFILDQPMAKKPGTGFNYSNGDVHLLSAIVQKATNKTALEFGWEYLFKPLGIADVEWSEDPRGITVGCAAMKLKPRDLAKFGLLYLNNGLWEGKQLISSKWIAESFRKHSTTYANTPNTFYGYLWWVKDGLNVYEAYGSGGIRIGVLPDLNIVTVTTANISEDWSDYVFFRNLYAEYIKKAVKSPTSLPENPETLERLRNREIKEEKGI